MVALWLYFFFLLWLFYTRFFGAEYYFTTQKRVKKMMKMAKVGRRDIVYDLGCGDARIVIASAQKCKKAIGIEIDPLRFLISTIKIKLLRVKNAKIIFGNLFSQNLKDADVVFLFLRQWTNDNLREKFEKEFKKGTRIVSHYWIFHGWKPVEEDKKLRLYSYVFGKVR